MDGQDLRLQQSGIDLEYLKSVPGLLKIGEIVCIYMYVLNLGIYSVNANLRLHTVNTRKTTNDLEDQDLEVI